MSYLALARKWRPTRFKEVVGQTHVLTALENALAQNRLHHAYLFSGTRGVGKTTIGRLFAKGLNCETGITATPCGECATCKEIDEGRFVDLLEIDAASRTKVEDTRELLDNVQYKPARGRFKVYLIDEVHMLSRHSFNALLKTLEEPPEYVKFLLATTDPQKLPVTILSRCLQFHLKPISVDNIHQQLEHILDAEGVEADARALGMIAHAADGSMRDALSLTDQAIALGNGLVEADSVAHMLGTLDTDQAIHLLEAISSKQAQTAMDAIQVLAQNGVEWDGLLQQLATQLHRIAMYQALPSTLDKAQPDAEKIELLSRTLSPQDVQLYYQIALKGRDDLPLAPTERIGLEMVVLRMMAFRPASGAIVNSISTATLQAAIPNSGQSLAAPAKPQPVAEQPVQPNQPTAAPHAANVAPEYDLPPTDYAPYGESEVPPAYDAPRQMTPASSPEPVQSPTPSTAPQERSGSSLSGLRHQLRSQRQGLKGNQPHPSPDTKAEPGVKKSSAASAKKESVLDRVAQKHGTVRMSPAQLAKHAAVPQAPAEDEPYQWKPANPVVEVKKQELTPTEIKKALEHEKTPEMAQKLVEESIRQDEWTALIEKLHTAKLVQQLALNSSFRKDGATIELALRQHQAHLNTDKAQQELLAALNAELGEECHLSVVISEDGETPLEVRDRLYKEKLEQAFVSLDNDPHVQFIERRFAAQLDRESVRPV
ncbi:DNA polymerase III subunit gamma/tau [Vibrio sp. V39_P1S14PM300]|uniref:DNA polymerase III subunit gamma/tau n=1 Tax=Vibrio sp. V39_P1S14PM300 TaxID=1938690 RepID=UPI0013730569|nr:DNA polymerase III subunit gamma/tau [Vibrio sp. V39_P1S14PM300]NAX21241.1 DNA polymerase III subunit gamma/tau [Vibrio sp. V39_P1S14PM300]